jgi:hypothetical protein
MAVKNLFYSSFCILILIGCNQRSQNPSCPNSVRLQWAQATCQNSPAARYDHTMAIDQENKRAFLFGGTNGEKRFNDLWVFDFTSNQWTQIESETKPQARSGHSLVFDPKSERLFLFGGMKTSKTGEMILLRDLWIYSNESGWQREFFEKGPSKRAWHAAELVNGNILILGGYNGAPGYHLNDIWSLNIKDLTFKRMSTDGGPKMAGRPVFVSDKKGSELVVLGRNKIHHPRQARLWRLTPKRDTWQLIDINPFHNSDYALSVANPSNSSFLTLYTPDDDSSDWQAWQTSQDLNHWCQLDMSGGPAIVHGMACVNDISKTNNWICFGGVFRDHISDQTWRISANNSNGA